MTKVRDQYDQASDQEQRQRIAELLARGVVRQLSENHPNSSIEEVAHKAENGLEVPAELRLHVSSG
ncbi:MAG: hypothetical protein ACE37H_00890 [Phycisphaeraceae bacterium]